MSERLLCYPLWNMTPTKILEKFGGNYIATQDTFHMGINHKLGAEIAQRFYGTETVLDTCTGAGFMTIALARIAKHVVSVDINPEHLEMTRKNSEIAGLKNISYILGDITDPKIIEKVGKVDSAFLDPDWAKPGDSKEIHVQDIEGMVPNGRILFELIHKITPNIAFRLPKEIDIPALTSLPSHEIVASKIDGKIKFFTAYFGSLKRN